MKTFVYVISGDHGRQKIGITDDPRQRIRTLQTGSPFALKFEFVGETENGCAGAIEVEAHFMLAQHKAPGGDEWFTVPPDVAVTAVMAAAHRLGYRVKPVDPEQATPQTFAIGQPRRPWWDKLAQAAVVLAACYLMVERGVSMPSVVISGIILYAFIHGALRLAATVDRKSIP